jgi:alkylhydroperoxidase family enzyme
MDNSTAINRIAPLNPPYLPEVAAMLEKWMPPGAAVEPLKLFRVMAQNPEMMKRMRSTGAGILGPASSIIPAEREIVIDRTCARCGCEYEWGVHVASFGQLPGYEKAVLTSNGLADNPQWTERERLLIRLVDELHDTSNVSDELWVQLTNYWTTPQLLELLIIVGWYHLISFLANATGLEPEKWAARFPQS